MRLTTSVRLSLCVVMLVPALVLGAACGSGGGGQTGPDLNGVLAAVDGLSGEQRTAKLVELADAEGGSVSLYTSGNLDYMEDIADGFEDEYGIDVAMYKASSEILAERLIEETKAGFHGADVLEDNTPGLINVDKEGIIAAYDSPALDGLVDGARGKSWIGDKFNTFVLAWNTDRVTKGNEPTSFEDLAKPEWKGRLGMELGDGDWYKTIWELLVSQGKTAAEADALFEAIARNATFVKGHPLLAELTAAGEFDVAVDAYLHGVKGLIEKGAPLAWQPAVEPLVSRPDGIAVVKDARHPAAAVLFTDYVLSEGQQVYADAFLTPARRDLSLPAAIGQVALDVPDYVAHQAEWDEKYEALAKLGKEGPTTS